jgi:UDP-N-acetylmuramate--alanine ligase
VTPPTGSETEREPAEPFHFIGIGGAGMSAVAELVLAAGHAVTGSDARPGATLDRLASLGAVVHVGHAAQNVAGAGTVVVSTAVRPDNVELVAAREAGVPVLHRSAALALVARGKDFVAVAGAHGKTTTSSMLALALREAGEDPSYAIGGEVLALGTGAHAGSGRAFVAEADESDRSFLAYSPRVAVVTNIEADHLDHYASVEAVHEAFAAFAARLVPGGLLVACHDDDGAARLARDVRGVGARVRTYGASRDDARLAGDDHVVVDVTELRPDGSSAVLTWSSPAGERTVPLRLAVPGRHNVLNAAGAWSAGVDLGVDPDRLAAALSAFTGTRRRFEDRGSAGGVRVVDDYAHHPTEVAALVAQARLAAGEGRVLVLFQPHLYSRTLTFAGEFADALAGADEVVVTGVYGAREEPRADVTSALITDAMAAAGAGDRARYVPDRLAAATAIADLAAPGDLLLTVGAGDVTELAGPILERLRVRG